MGAQVSDSIAQAISRLGELVDAAAIAPEHWQAVCRGIQDVLPDGRVLMQGYDASAPYAMPLAGVGWEDVNFDVYFGHYAALNPWTPAWTDLPVLRSTLSDTVLPRRILERTEFYNDWIKPMGGADSASGIKIVQDRSRMATLCVHYDRRGAEKSHDALVPLFQALAPKMRRALDCNRAVLRNTRSPLGDSLMRNLIDPALVLDGDCRVLDLNTAAQELSGGGRSLRVTAGDRLVLGDAQAQAKLALAVAAVCSRRPGSIGRHDVSFRQGPERLSLSVLPVTQNLREYAFGGSASLFIPGTIALVIIRRELVDSSIELDALRRRFDLSPQEARIALALRDGGTVAEIAVHLGIAYETARVHLKSAFAKTDTHRQRELLALVLDTTGPRG
ncbi:MAG TPA: helix-turn-helix transcriptional regulator [Bosea sp. (in: a-proteobacteria)]|jgi:DNA-binding CsgD family transcriptional regulator|nr:helix-turn-helix transcriptional regulator [Bosea sp. (in: a-proteobacteria)]